MLKINFACANIVNIYLIASYLHLGIETDYSEDNQILILRIG